MPQPIVAVSNSQSQFSTFVLPPIVEEKELSPFKFWYDNRIQDGAYYRGELFYRMRSVQSSQQNRLYSHACEMAPEDVVILTNDTTSCSIWVSLRSPNARLLHHGSSSDSPKFLN